MSQKSYPPKKRRHQYLAAVVLGTAIAALGSPQKASAAEVADTSQRSVNDVSRYCSACWRNARLPIDRWGDCTQEVFKRLLQRVSMTQWSRLWALDSPERREFLRAIDAVKKRVQRERKRSPLNDNDLPAAIAERQVEERAAVDLAAATLLSPRQQRIVQMICDGWTIPDMAQELAIPVQRVSDEKYKAIQKLRAHFQGAEEVRL